MKTIQINDRTQLNDLTRKAKQASKFIAKLGSVRVEVSRRHDSDNKLVPLAQQFADLAGSEFKSISSGSETKNKIFLELR